MRDNDWLITKGRIFKGREFYPISSLYVITSQNIYNTYLDKFTYYIQTKNIEKHKGNMKIPLTCTIKC